MLGFVLASLLGDLSAPPQQPQPPVKQDKEIVVTGTTPEVSDRIDRRVYDIKNDPQAQTGLLIDLIAKLPSVTVSPSGKIMLRGDPNVVVLLDGKPLIGGNGSLQTLQASDIDRIEIMTNPSSQYAPDGGSGIINIITKKRHAAGITGSVSGRASSLGQTGISLSTFYSKGNWLLDGKYGASVSDRNSQTINEKTTPDKSLTNSASKYRLAGQNLGIGVTYKLPQNSSLSIKFQNYSFGARDRTNFSFISGNGDFQGHTKKVGKYKSKTSNIIYELNNRLNTSQLIFDYYSSYGTNHDFIKNFSEYSNGELLDYISDHISEDSEDILRINLEKKFNAGAILTGGSEINSKSINLQRLYENAGSNFAQFDFNSANRYSAKRVLFSTYLTYQFPLHGWVLLPGLRLERERRELTNEKIGIQTDEQRAFPSLHLSRAISGASDLKISYSRRIDRPGLTSYDPNITYYNSVSGGQGNPLLKPSEIDAFEAGVSRRSQNSNFDTTLYYRIAYDKIDFFTREVNDGLFVTSFVNGGNQTSHGLEINFKKSINNSVKYSISSNIFETELKQLVPGSRNRQSGSYLARGQFEITSSNSDRYEISISATGKTLTNQGYVDSFCTIDGTWTRSISPNATLTLSLSDITNSNRQRRVIVTATESYVIKSPASDRAIRIAVAHKFGNNIK